MSSLDQHAMASTILAPASIHTVVLSENTASPPHSNNNHVVIRLDAVEERLFSTLIQAANAFQQGSVTLDTQAPHRIDVRVAGGWVRDKLLGRHTHDVDIAIDTVSGVDFATIVQSFLRETSPQDVHRMGVIAANPSQSKHLETATMRVYTIDVDFCNLRSQEVYEAHSRIPTTQFGTPLEDAQRRDFTINALFFNLRTQQVEDWTGRGLADLKQRVLVTPLCPSTTFHDDPLRVLRAIRFAVRYNMKLDTALEEACRDVQVHETLHVKISRERVGKELEAMLSGKSAKPQEALETIGRLGLADSVFCLPDGPTTIQGRILGHAWNERDATRLETMGWEEACQVITFLPPVLIAFLQYIQTVPSITTQVNVRLLHLGVFMSPFRHLFYKDRKSKLNLVTTYMVKESLKFKNADGHAMTILMEHIDSWKDMLTSSRSVPVRRLDAGLLLQSCKNQWITTLLVATVLKAREQSAQEPAQNWIQTCLNLYRTIVDMGLDECWNMRPLLNGREVIHSLQLPQGPLVQQFLGEQKRWMLEHPNGTRDECERFLHRKKHELEKPKHGSPIMAARKHSH